MLIADVQEKRKRKWNMLVVGNQLKNIKQLNKKKFFLSLLISLFQSLCFSLKESNVSHNPNKKYKTKSSSYYNNKVESGQQNKGGGGGKRQADLTQSGGGQVDEVVLHGDSASFVLLVWRSQRRRGRKKKLYG